MSSSAKAFDISCQDDTVIVMPLTDLRELDFQRIEQEARAALEHLEKSPARNVVLDFTHTDYFGSTALGFFLKLWKRVRSRNGHMALCQVSANEKEILSLARLDTLWSVCGTRDEALAAVRQGAV